MDARTTALQALTACHRQGAWSDSVLRVEIARAKLDRRDAALASRLCYGVLQNQMLLDAYLSRFVTGGLVRLQPVVLDILRLAVCQILLLDKIPASAAVNEAVKQAKRFANDRAAGLVNGVLRNLLRQLPLTPPTDLATRYSHPQPLVELLEEVFGPETEQLLACHNDIPPTTIQCNTLVTTPVRLAASLEEAGVTWAPHPWLPGCLELTGTGNLEQLPAYQDGWFYVQDAAANLAVRCAGLTPGMRVLDCCAAPGGKTFAAAIALENRGSITSCDIHQNKTERIVAGARRMHMDIVQARPFDAKTFAPDWEEAMDAVICDVPCSGLGVIRKKPDIRYKDLNQIARLPALQLEILENQARYVKPGGVLLYSTCTILPRENEAVVDAFLAKHPDYRPEQLFLPEPLEQQRCGMLTLTPHRHGTDGFFIAKLRRSL